VGVGMDECRWPRPVRPGDELRVECKVLDVRPSKSRPEQGLIKIRTTTLNQDDETVLVHVLNLVVPRRKDIREEQRAPGTLSARTREFCGPFQRSGGKQ